MKENAHEITDRDRTGAGLAYPTRELTQGGRVEFAGLRAEPFEYV